MAIAQKKSYLKVGSNSVWKYILAICGVLILAMLLIIFVIKPYVNLSEITEFIKTHFTNICSWFKNFFSNPYVKYILIILLIIAGLSLICFFKAKNIILSITTILYSIIFCMTFSGINIMNSYWFWILLIIAELLAIIVSCIVTGDSFFTCCESVLIQLFVLVPVWIIMYCLCSYVAEQEKVGLENLFYLILQFATFATVLGYQLIIMFSDGDAITSIPDIVVDMTGDED